MKVLGLDLGTKTLGTALADDKTLISLPHKTVVYSDINKLIEEVKSIIQEENVSEIALGLPKNMDGSLGFAAERSISFKEELEKKIDIPITLVDERLSTMEAEKYLIENSVKKGAKKKVIDSVAASIILNTYMRMKGNEKNE